MTSLPLPMPREIRHAQVGDKVYTQIKSGYSIVARAGLGTEP